MATSQRRWTRADLEYLPADGNRYEVLNGALLVTPQASYRHQRIAARLMVILHRWCEQHRVGTVVGPGSIPVGDSEVQPDVQVVPYGVYPDDVKWDALPRPLLVVEIRSDATWRRDIGIKRRAYQQWRIPTYWVLDPDNRRAMVWTPDAEDPVIVTDTLQWQPDNALPALGIPLEELFTTSATTI